MTNTAELTTAATLIKEVLSEKGTPHFEKACIITQTMYILGFEHLSVPYDKNTKHTLKANGYKLYNFDDGRMIVSLKTIYVRELTEQFCYEIAQMESLAKGAFSETSSTSQIITPTEVQERVDVRYECFANEHVNNIINQLKDLIRKNPTIDTELITTDYDMRSFSKIEKEKIIEKLIYLNYYIKHSNIFDLHIDTITINLVSSVYKSDK